MPEQKTESFRLNAAYLRKRLFLVLPYSYASFVIHLLGLTMSSISHSPKVVSWLFVKIAVSEAHECIHNINGYTIYLYRFRNQHESD
jgi:hypothetical protein